MILKTTAMLYTSCDLGLHQGSMCQMLGLTTVGVNTDLLAVDCVDLTGSWMAVRWDVGVVLA